MKKIVAKTGQYTTQQGETKNNWTTIGVILSNQHGEYIMLDPSVDLAGVLMKQRVLAQKTNGKAGDNVMCSIFEEQQQPQAPQHAKQAAQPAGGFEDDSIPFIQIGPEHFA